MTEITQDDIFNAVLKDRLETDFLAFVCYFHKQITGESFLIGKHHREICDALMDIYKGKKDKKNLIVNIPPRYGKTQIMIYFCAWTMAKHPKAKTMHLSYSDDLVKLNSRAIKNTLTNDVFKTLWPIEFAHEEQHHWINKDGGGFYAASTGGQVTGFGAGSNTLGEWGGFIWIDDPMKPVDADSERMRGQINAMISSTVRSRRNSRETPIILIMQRLHDEDTTGYILRGATAHEWTHLSMPAVNDKKEALWPYKHSYEELELERKNDKWMFASQYMQDPVPDDGEYFSKQDARFYGALPKDLTYYICSDIALTMGKGDFTEHAVLGVDKNDDIYVADWYYGQVDDAQVVDELVTLTEKWNPRFLGNEGGITWRAIEGSLVRKLKDRKIYVSLEVTPSAGAKQIKASSFQGLWRSHKVYFPNQAPWADRVMNQMYRFPFGKNDDAVDALSVFGRLIDKVIFRKPVERSKPKLVVANRKWM